MGFLWKWSEAFDMPFKTGCEAFGRQEARQAHCKQLHLRTYYIIPFNSIPLENSRGPPRTTSLLSRPHLIDRGEVNLFVS